MPQQQYSVCVRQWEVLFLHQSFLLHHHLSQLAEQLTPRSTEARRLMDISVQTHPRRLDSTQKATHRHFQPIAWVQLQAQACPHVRRVLSPLVQHYPTHSLLLQPADLPLKKLPQATPTPTQLKQHQRHAALHSTCAFSIPIQAAWSLCAFSILCQNCNCSSSI